MKDKRQLFLNIWNKKNSPVRDRIKSKLQCRGIEPSELNCYEYWMGYIKPWADVRGNIHHVNPFRNEAFMRSYRYSGASRGAYVNTFSTSSGRKDRYK